MGRVHEGTRHPACAVPDERQGVRPLPGPRFPFSPVSFILILPPILLCLLLQRAIPASQTLRYSAWSLSDALPARPASCVLDSTLQVFSFLVKSCFLCFRFWSNPASGVLFSGQILLSRLHPSARRGWLRRVQDHVRRHIFCQPHPHPSPPNKRTCTRGGLRGLRERASRSPSLWARP